MNTLHGLALRAYPPAFRREFGAELQRIFEERTRGRSRALLAFFLIVDTVVSGLAERARARHDQWAWPRHAHATATKSQLMTWESVGADLHLAWRHIRATPLFAVLTIASLALGIGANSAMFAMVNTVLLQPLPYADADRLVTIWSDNQKAGEKMNPVSPANFEALRAAPSLQQVEALYSFLTPLQVRIGAEPEAALASQVTRDMFTLLGRSPGIGRTFGSEPDGGGVILSHGYWQRRFGGAADVVGRTVSIVGVDAPLQVIGVMPEDFTFPYGTMLAASGFTREVNVDIWLMMSRERDWRLVDRSGQPNRGIHYFAVVARLRPGATLEQARTELKAIASARAVQFPDTNQGWGVTVHSLHDQTVGSVRPALIILFAGVGVVLLITCINVANVLLARAAAHGRDLSIRTALGASRARLVQQTLTESVMLAVIGGTVGLAVMVAVMRATIALAPANLPRLSEVRTDATVVLFALALAIVTGIAVGLFPALSAAASPAQDSLRESNRATSSPARRRTRGALIVAEVALAMTLTACGGLLLRSFVQVLGVDPGFNPGQLLTMQVSVPPRAQQPDATLPFYDVLEERLRALPGVVAVGGTTRLPLGSTNVTTMLEVDGRPVPPAQLPEVEMRRALFDYFGAMQIPVIRGRAFTREDGPTAPRVAVVNAALAERVFPGEEVLGRRVRFGGPNSQWLTIVGVVGDIRHTSLEAEAKPEFYITYRQGPPTGPYIVLRTSGDAAALAAPVRQALRELGVVPPTEVRTMEAIRSGSVASRRFLLVLVGAFGVLALTLAALGVFGVITLVAAERTREVGIRLALGAVPVDVMRLLLGDALKLAALGIAVGVGVAVAATPLVRTQLFGVSAMDPVTFVVVASGILFTAAAAAYVPARRAMRVDPASALRN